MAKARQQKFHRRRKAPFVGRFLRRTLGVEQLCDECSRPYLSKPAAQPIEQFVQGSAVASVFVEHQFGKARYHVQLGRFAANGQEMFISQFLGIEQLEDIATLTLMAAAYIRGQKPLRLVSRG